MTVKECYEKIGGDYADVTSRLRTDERIARFLGKVADDKSMELLETSLESRNMEEAFRAAHTIKGVCMNLSLTDLLASAVNMTEALRGRTEYGEDLIPLFEDLKKQYGRTVEGIRALLNSL